MTTKEQANEAADALLAAAQTEQKRAAERNTLPLVRMYPALKDIPALERIAAVRDARDLAHAHSVSRALIALVTIALAGPDLVEPDGSSGLGPEGRLSSRIAVPLTSGPRATADAQVPSIAEQGPEVRESGLNRPRARLNKNSRGCHVLAPPIR